MSEIKVHVATVRGNPFYRNEQLCARLYGNQYVGEGERIHRVALSRPLSRFSHTITKMTVVAEESFVQQYLVCTVYSRNEIAVTVKM